MPVGPARITSWYPKFNGSHFGLSPSSIHRMTGLGDKMVWTVSYLHRHHTIDCFQERQERLTSLDFSSSSIRLTRRSFCSENVTNWSRAFWLTWLYFFSSALHSISFLKSYQAKKKGEKKKKRIDKQYTKTCHMRENWERSSLKWKQTSEKKKNLLLKEREGNQTPVKRMGAVRIPSLYPKFNGSHFGLPSSSIDKMTGLGSKMCEQWRMRTGLIEESTL